MLNGIEMELGNHQETRADVAVTVRVFYTFILLNALKNNTYVWKPLRNFCITILAVFIVGHLRSAGPVSIMKQSFCIVQQTGTVPSGGVCEGQAEETCLLKAGFPTVHVRCRIR